MKLKPGLGRILISCCVLAGLLVVGINGYALLALLDEPLSGYSEGIRTVDRGLLEFRKLSADKSGKVIHGIDRLAGRYTPELSPESSPVSKKVIPKKIVTKRVKALPASLPVLTGILTGYSTNGSTRRLAMLDGAVCAEGEKLGDLTVEEITIRGVRLNNGEKIWFVKAPDNNYSLSMQ